MGPAAILAMSAVSGLVSGWGARKETKARNDQLEAQKVILGKQAQLKILNHELTTFNEFVSREAAGQQRLFQAMTLGGGAGATQTGNILARFDRLIAQTQEKGEDYLLDKELDIIDAQIGQLAKGQQDPNKAFWTNALSTGIGTGTSMGMYHGWGGSGEDKSVASSGAEA